MRARRWGCRCELPNLQQTFPQRDLIDFPRRIHVGKADEAQDIVMNKPKLAIVIICARSKAMSTARRFKVAIVGGRLGPLNHVLAALNSIEQAELTCPIESPAEYGRG
jgi:hypothetical protein